MICRTCGTEIADKAIVCFRCGTPTAEPQPRTPPPRRSQSGLVASLLALVGLTVAALFMSRAAVGGVPQAVTWILVGIALVAVVWRLVLG
jgi:hypothetical protein